MTSPVMRLTATAHTDSAPRPRRGKPRAILIGTAATVTQLHLALASHPDSPIILGGILATGGAAEGELATPVLGGIDDLPAVLAQQRIDLALVCMPAVMTLVRQAVTDTLDRAAITWRWMPPLADQLAGRLGQASCAAVPSVDLARLIDREARPLDDDAIARTITGRTVMITGAGGSIGSEIARLVAGFDPGRLLLVERSENALFEIDREIARLHPALPRAALLHDVTHPTRTRALLEQHRPHVVFHAAAHKHVPMMEDHPAEAIENNFFGTRCVADAADAAGVDRFVMISTDKAVNPASVMGASKRLAELYIQHLNRHSHTRFCMVRFGNVLGSACSVLPIWSQQIARGEAVTVTDDQMQRYFMTIPEAAGLVLQSAAFCHGGEVFLLDMGRPVRIIDLARRFVRSMGLEPDVDVPIRITGIRPGEKLHEELAYAGEDMLTTPHESIRLWRTHAPQPAAMRQIIDAFDRLRGRRSPDDGQPPAHPWQHASRDAILAALHASIPEMTAAAA
jgi:FlaA1/EpsC-like NDP-sugar epimerase